jgi:hypothetical protein
LGLKRHGEPIQEGLKAIDEGYRTIIGYTALAAFYGAADKIPEAKSALAEAIKLNPKLSVAWFLRRIPSYINSPPDFRDNMKKSWATGRMSALRAPA